MRKILIIVLVIFVVGCTKAKTASEVVINYLKGFNIADDSLKSEIDDALKRNGDYLEEDQKKYKQILLRQYKDLKFDILKEEYDEDKALITVNVNVYDLSKAEESALEYLKENLNEFYDESNKFDNDKYLLSPKELKTKTA